MLPSLLAGTIAAIVAAGAGGHPIAATKAHTGPATAAPTTAHAARTAHVASASNSMMADSIVVAKSSHTLTLFRAGQVIKTFRVALGRVPVGDKVRQGDHRTPEGLFYIDARNPGSKYYKALHISYPDAAHQERARELGVPAGGDVMIHGLPDRFKSYGESQADNDWTEGCIALSDQQMDEIWRDVPVGTPILIKP